MKTLAVYGVGLIGASLALAARKHDLFDRILGCDVNADNLARAISLGVCNGELVESDQVDAVCIAVPTNHIASIVTSAVKRFGPDLPIFDVGSLKSTILLELDCVPRNFVPCHPIAGSSNSGSESADLRLFEDSVCVLTPTPDTGDQFIEQVRRIWESIGSEVILRDPDTHDATLALTSHMPHLLGFAIVNVLSRREGYDKFIGAGFRDFSRIAGSNAKVWSSILSDNAKFIVNELHAVVKSLEDIMTLASRDEEALNDRLEKISSFRRSLDA